MAEKKTVKKDIQKIKAVPKSKPEIGIDTNNTFPNNLLDAAVGDTLDTGILENFSTVSQTREQIYSLIDTMAQDSTLAAVIESYAEDATEFTDSGKIMWAESNDEKVSRYVNYLLDSLNVDKHIYSWVYSMVKYGDVYLRLYRQSDYGTDLLFGESEEKKTETLNESKEDLLTKVDDEYGKLNESEIDKLEGKKESLKEAVYLNVPHKNDPYVHYVEMVANPGEMFELTKFGKTVGYISAPVTIQTKQDTSSNFLNRYKMNKRDVTVYAASDFVHGCIEDNSGRVPEEVTIFVDNDVDKDNVKETRKATYRVKRGQSILYNQFKSWRELTLLENSVLLNRLTKSAVSRLMQVEVGDMPKSKVVSHLNNLKTLFKQKAAINKGESYQEYTNPGPMENLVILPVHEGKGKIEVSTMGGDVDPKQLTDLSWFQDKLFGGLRVPKQFFGVTDDNAGFSGGESLAIISSKYGKAVKRIQNTACQMITDLINLMLVDKGLFSYINKFVIKLQPPVTKDEQEKRANNDNRIRYVSDIMQQFADVDDELFKLKLDKLLLSPIINDSEIVDLIQDKIDEIESKEEATETTTSKKEAKDEEEAKKEEDSRRNIGGGFPSIDEEEPYLPEESSEEEIVSDLEATGDEDSYLPSAEELGVDMTQNS